MSENTSSTQKQLKPSNYRGNIYTDNLAHGHGHGTLEGITSQVEVSPLSIPSKDFIPNKPYRTEDELISLLNSRGLYIGDKLFAKQAFENLTYYDLINGYQNFFMRENRFLPGTTIEFLYEFKLYDLQIQNILFKYSLMVENRFKNILAQYLGKHYGVHQAQYLNKFYYSIGGDAKNKFERVLSDITRLLKANPQDIDEPSRHYKKKHNHIPPWILFKNITFSTVIDLFSLLNSTAKYDISYNLIWLRCQYL